jgi:hypothetical protein
LKTYLDAMFVKHNLSMSSLRGQGYDGASNMRGELHGLKTLVLADNPRRSRKMVTCLHHYKVQIFNEVLDRNIVEMNHRFSETSTRLLLCTPCLDPRDSFNSFDNDMLVELATTYSANFSSHDCCLFG